MQILPVNDCKSGLKPRRIPLGSEFSTGDNAAAVLLLERMFTCIHLVIPAIIGFPLLLSLHDPLSKHTVCMHAVPNGLVDEAESLLFTITVQHDHLYEYGNNDFIIPKSVCIANKV